jgi:Zn-finger domain-containing protein
MYRTADNLEDLDIEMELNSFDSVGHAVGRSSFSGIDEKYHDVDFYIMMIDDTEEDEIKKLLNSCGWTAWLEYDLEDECKMVKVA